MARHVSLLAVSFALAASAAWAQKTDSRPTLLEQFGMRPNPHVPLPHHVPVLPDYATPGCWIEAHAQGRVRDEARPAHAIIVKCPAKEDNGPTGYSLALYLQNPGGGYDLAAENRTFIPTLSPEQRKFESIGLGSDPKTPPLEFKNGSLVVTMDVTALAGPTADRVLTYTLRYRDSRLWVSGLDEFIVTFRLRTVHNSYNFLTGKAQLSKGTGCAGRADALSRCRYNGAWKQILTPRAPSLDDVGDGTTFEPKVD